MVYFVGAGPGAVDLITVRGMRLLEKADVIIYTGSLVDSAMLEYTRPEAIVYNSAVMTLEEVTDVIITAHSEQRSVVRLHTGEPSLYGAVREQMDVLDKRGIPYESCPGVSACFGAAASLNMEYTLPGISQSLIITRMEGRTPVPEKESIESFASHGSSMAIYLSAGMMEELSKRLVDGGYDKNTPAAIVYKATHPDEKTVICTVGSLAEAAGSGNITKTAVVLIGEAITHASFDRSKLYDPDFATGYRNSSLEKIVYKKAICFNESGRGVIKRLNSAAEDAGIEPAQIIMCDRASMNKTVEESFRAGNALIFVGAVGIAVRAISPFVKDKLTDSPVIVIDDRGEYVIPILSGHAGGANKLAASTAQLLGAVAVITTSTDVNGAFSPDVFAAENRLAIRNRDGIKKVSAKALEGKSITLSVKDYPPKEPVDIIIADETDREYTLLLTPKRYIVGIGMRRDKDPEEAEEFILSVLKEHDIAINDVYALSTIDIKEDERAIRSFSYKYRIPVIGFEASLLNKAEGDFTSSDFVSEKVGTDNVCERAAVLAAGPRAKLICRKTKGVGITAAIASIGEI
ncbi:MAG: precorrin-4 C(11)-methyltransferase [Lachnospiraceae bacterium]|nr:precorrin-4 C(11)-methyltransferase [Lachnospiraceae bacterium]